MRLVFFKSTASHKYVKRTGVPGNYKYWYRTPEGKIVEGANPEKPVSGKAVGTKIGELEKRADGYWYKGKIKVTDSDEKAMKFSEGAAGSEQKTTPPEIKEGAKVRIKSTSKGASGKARGIVGTIKEVGKDFIRLADESGNVYRVGKDALEMAKSSDDGVEFELSLLKSVRGSSKTSHKYWKRTGTSGKYRYWYKDAKGRVVEGKRPEVEKKKMDPIESAKLHKLKQTKTEMEIASIPKANRAEVVTRMLALKKKKISPQLKMKIVAEAKKLPELPVVQAVGTARQAESQSKIIESRSKGVGVDSELDQQSLIDEKQKIIDTGKGKTKLAFIQKQIEKKEKTRTPQEKMQIALKIETKKENPKALGFNLRTITKGQLQKLQSNQKLRNQFLIENQALVNDVAARAVKHWREHMFDYATFDDAKQDAQLGLMLAIKKFNAKKKPIAMFLNYSRKVMTQKMHREMYIRMSHKLKETSIYDEIPGSKGEAPLTIADTLEETRDAFAFERELGIINKMEADLKANGKEKKNERAIQVLRYLAQGHKPADAAKALYISRGQVAKLIQRKLLPLIKKYLIKSDGVESFIKMLEDFVSENTEK